MPGNAYATKLAEGFAKKVLRHQYATSPIEEFVNRDYDSEVDEASKINILTFDKVTEKDYSGSALSADSIYETNSILDINKAKSYYFKIKTLDKWKSYIKNPKGTILEQTANERKKNVMTHLLSFYADAAAGNWYGTDYTTGSVTVTTVTGAVTGVGTTFTAAMVGRPFKATGHTQWYRVKTYSSATSIVIEDDSDDLTSAYTGGAIAGGTAYTIQAATVKTIDNSTNKFLSMVDFFKQTLDDLEVPDEDRVLLIPPAGHSSLRNDPGIKLDVPAAYEELVNKGGKGMLDGFNVIVQPSSRFTGDNTNGFYIVAAHKAWLTFGDAILNVGQEEDLPGDFGMAYKDLYVYGAKVADSRRKFACTAFVKFA